MSGHARGRDGSSPEGAGSRYPLGTKLRHFQKLLAVLPSDLIANASIVIVTTSNNPRRCPGKSLIGILVNRISFEPSCRKLLGSVEIARSSDRRLRRLGVSSQGLDVTVEIPREISDNRILAGLRFLISILRSQRLTPHLCALLSHRRYVAALLLLCCCCACRMPRLAARRPCDHPLAASQHSSVRLCAAASPNPPACVLTSNDKDLGLRVLRLLHDRARWCFLETRCV